MKRVRASNTNIAVMKEKVRQTNHHRKRATAAFNAMGKKRKTPVRDLRMVSRPMAIAATVKQEAGGNVPIDQSVPLRPLWAHQSTAVKFIQAREASDVRGGLLCDEMGVGKTQTMLHLPFIGRKPWVDGPLSTPREAPTLIVTSPILMEVVRREAEVSYPACFRVHAIGSHQVSAAMSLHESPPTTPGDPHHAWHDVVVVTYPVLLAAKGAMDDGRNWQPLRWLFEVKWERMFTDEGHTFCNPSTGLFRCVQAVQAHARWYVSGTPMQNRASDITAALEYIRAPLPAGLPIAKPGDDQAELALARTLGEIARPYVLRRTHAEIMSSDIPRTTTILPRVHRALNMVARVAPVQETLIWNPDDAFREVVVRIPWNANDLTTYEKIAPSVSLDDLAECGTLDPTTEEAVPLSPETGAPSTTFTTIGPLRNLCISQSKLEVTRVLLRAIPEDDSIVIFVEQVNHGKKLMEQLRGTDSERPMWMLHGSVSHRKREETFEAFREAKGGVLILTLKLGTMGLNLQSANHVIFVSIWYNPQPTRQGSYRIARFGQTKETFVYILIMEDSVEEYVACLIKHKLGLARAFFGSVSRSNLTTSTTTPISDDTLTSTGTPPQPRG